jgi:acyl dehydratase
VSARSLTPRTVGPLGPVEVARYAGASGDYNPLHLDVDAAKAAGYPGIFVMGLLPASILATYVADQLGLDNLRSFAVRYRKQVWLGDTVTCAGEVNDSEPGLLTVELSCSTDREGTVLTATAVVSIG